MCPRGQGRPRGLHLWIVVYNFALTVGNFFCSALFTYPMRGTNVFKIQHEVFCILNMYLYFKLQIHPKSASGELLCDLSDHMATFACISSKNLVIKAQNSC